MARRLDVSSVGPSIKSRNKIKMKLIYESRKMGFKPGTRLD